ncbi:MAG: hypothetical protein C0417_12490 [Chlorobiaceae bacterium]|nr:hypothetical protein [Chlorobiaceae bacterium]
MKTLIIFFIAIIFLSVFASAADFKVIGLKGAATVRHGVNERWISVSVGDVLSSDDSIELDKQSSATLLTGTAKITLPEMVIVDLSDLRLLSQEDLLMKLAMENIKSIPPRDDIRELNIPRVTTVHGEKREQSTTKAQSDIQNGVKQLNGCKVLYRSGYYATCALKVKQVFRLYPILTEDLDIRMLIASSFEKMNLNKEALEEYHALLEKSLPEEKRLKLNKKIELLTSMIKSSKD